MEVTTVSITVELRLEGDSVSGRAACPDGRERPFSGWVGMVGAIDALVAGCEPAEQSPPR